MHARQSLFRRGDHEIREVAAAVVANPQPDLASIELTKLPNFEGDLLDGPNKDLNRAAFDEHAEPDPVRRDERSIDGIFELLGKLIAKVLKIKFRQRDVLDGVLLARGILCAKVERPQINGLVRYCRPRDAPLSLLTSIDID